MSQPDERKNAVLLPPREVFEDDGLYVGADEAHPESKETLPIAIGVEFPKDGGVLLHFDRQKYPKKGWPFKNAILSIDAVKRFVMCIVRFSISLPGNIFRGRVIRSAMEQFADFSSMVFQRHGAYWKPNFWCTMVREIWRAGSELTTDEVEVKFLKSVCSILEFDDAYRYFLQDLLGEMDVIEFLKNPSKEARRIFRIAESRGEGTREKFHKFGIIISLLLHVPKIRRTAKRFFARVDMEKLYLDINDQYQTLTWSGWDFGGRTLYARLLMREAVDDEWQKSGSKHIDSEGNEIIIPEKKDE